MARIMFIVDSDFEDSEFRVPYDRVKQAGHEAVIVGIEAGKQLKGKKGKETIVAEKSAKDVSVDDFDALVIPGGYSPDHLRMDAGMVELVRSFFQNDKPVAAICHAGWMLAEADIVDGRTLTSWPSIKTDLINAGARWVDREVIEDGNLITSRKPDDLDAFCGALLRQIDEGISPRIGQGMGIESEQPAVH
ncbi:type 1 glutamine amidotransferase domain-containing protein [Hyalangium gracile]|uniref:type 1 glutamine amidotransferase domain-containing protein n=1 Tax=Hyalangium gracile TaxID=394092 RepID=UPI001CCC1559|nr:type 1 glutamine amidotransferase domain-containing protein [Hyalangium gracile]